MTPPTGFLAAVLLAAATAAGAPAWSSYSCPAVSAGAAVDGLYPGAAYAPGTLLGRVRAE